MRQTRRRLHGALDGEGQPVAAAADRDVGAPGQERDWRRVLETLMSNLPGMAYRCLNDPQWTMLFVSDGCRELTGYSPAELTGKGQINFADLICAADRQGVWEYLGSWISPLSG